MPESGVPRSCIAARWLTAVNSAQRIPVAQRRGLCQNPPFEFGIPGDTMTGFHIARGGLVLAMAAMATAALAGVPADPAGSGVIVGAVNWLQGTLLGTVATVAAVIAVAAVGFMMLTGRINWRHGAVVILGCFILFGAASIVAGIRAAAAGG